MSNGFNFWWLIWSPFLQWVLSYRRLCWRPMKVIYEIGCNDGLHIKYPIISSYSACSFWAKIMVLVFILDDFEMIHMIGSCPLITTQWLVSMSGFYCPNYSTHLKNWENQLHRHQRDLCHPSKLVRWRELWASFGHSLAPPPTHTDPPCTPYYTPPYPTQCPTPPHLSASFPFRVQEASTGLHLTECQQSPAAETFLWNSLPLLCMLLLGQVNTIGYV